VADGIILEAVDVTFEILWRRGDEELVLARWQQHFDPRPGMVGDAIPFEATAAGPAVDVERGDLLVLRLTGQSATIPMAYVPNGEGARAKGRIPYIDLPP